MLPESCIGSCSPLPLEPYASSTFPLLPSIITSILPALMSLHPRESLKKKSQLNMSHVLCQECLRGHDSYLLIYAYIYICILTSHIYLHIHIMNRESYILSPSLSHSLSLYVSGSYRHSSSSDCNRFLASPRRYSSWPPDSIRDCSCPSAAMPAFLQSRERARISKRLTRLELGDGW